MAALRNPSLLKVKRGRRLKLSTGEEISPEEVAEAYGIWGEILVNVDNRERNIVYSAAEFEALPAIYVEIKRLCGFNKVDYDRENIRAVVDAVFAAAGGKK